MSTNATSAEKPVSSAGSTIKPTSPRAADKGKGKGRGKEVGEEDEDEDEDEEDDDDDDDDDEDEMEEDEEDDDVETYEGIDPTAIIPTGRRTRGVRVDYTSQEALRKAGLGKDDKEEDCEDPFAEKH